MADNLTTNGCDDTDEIIAKAKELVNLENKDELKQEIVKILSENSQLKTRVQDLEEIVDGACSSKFMVDTVPMDEDESKNPSISYNAPSEQQFVEVLTTPVPEDQGKELF